MTSNKAPPSPWSIGAQMINPGEVKIHAWISVGALDSALLDGHHHLGLGNGDPFIITGLETLPWH